MLRLIFIFTLLTLVSLTRAQVKGEVFYKKKCNTKPECVRCDTPAKWKDVTNLTQYFEARIDSARLDKIKAMVTVHATAAANGMLCARSFEITATENIASDIELLKLDGIISKMPAMKPAIKNGKPVSSDVTLVFIININMQKFYVSAY